MFSKLKTLNFSPRREVDRDTSRYFVQGKGEVRLSRSDFKAQGGEGAIYVKGSTAYKVYTDPRRAIPPAKIGELSALTLSNIIRPLDLLLDQDHKPAGYSMRHLDGGYALCQLFPKSFRARKNLTPEAVFRLVGKMREGVCHVHSKGILIVDLNEMNFLVSDNFEELFFIDVDSYQTPSFAATVLMESVRDRHAKTFSVNTDWFSFAVVSFQMFTGIHPFKGTYPPLQQGTTDKDRMLDARMRANISVLHPEVRVPAACLPFSIIPPAYFDWYRAVFEEGRRLPPPEPGAPAVIRISPVRAEQVAGDGRLEFMELREFDDEVISHDGVITVTRSSVYFGGGTYANPAAAGETRVLVTPRLRHLIVASLRDGQVCFQDLTAGRSLRSDVRGEEIMVYDGRLYVRQAAAVMEVEFLEVSEKVLATCKTVGHVMPRAARLYDGACVQNMLGAHYVSLFPERGTCVQARLGELNGYQVLDAKFSGRVLLVLAAKAGRYDKFVFRFAADFGSYDVRLTPDVTLTGLNFIALDSGVCLHLNDGDELELFSARRGAPELKLIRDAGLGGDDKLFRVGRQAMFARGNKLYSFKLRATHA